jgi:hypothetical protein
MLDALAACDLVTVTRIKRIVDAKVQFRSLGFRSRADDHSVEVRCSLRGRPQPGNAAPGGSQTGGTAFAGGAHVSCSGAVAPGLPSWFVDIR